MRLTEDDRYRRSTQFKLWSFTPEALETLRVNTNRTAAQRTRAAFRRRRDVKVASEKSQNGGSSGQSTPQQEVDCLTLEEEQMLVKHYCRLCLQIGSTKLQNEPHVTATAVQYMKRFYLFNSPMTYHPKAITGTALFLALKVEDRYKSLNDGLEGFVDKIDPRKKTKPDDVLAPEFTLTQALRFTFDVRHPYRGLKGGRMELLAIANGTVAVLPGMTKTASDLQQDILQLPLTPGAQPIRLTVVDAERRIAEAYAKANECLKSIAPLTDVYFLYTPSQIWLAALFLADEVLALFFISTKVPDNAPDTSFKGKVINTVRACADLLAVGAESSRANIEELRRVDKKLYQCLNPEKIDLVGLNKAQKRDAVDVDGKLDESLAKRRKLEREKAEKEAESFWGPELKKPTAWSSQVDMKAISGESKSSNPK